VRACRSPRPAGRHVRGIRLAAASTLAVALKPMFEEQARKRILDGQERGRQAQKGTVANLPQTDHAKSRDQAAAAAVGVGPVALKPMFEEQARRNQPQSLKVGHLPPLEKAKSRDQAAAAVGVSGRIVQDAEHVKKHSPEAFEEVKPGRIAPAGQGLPIRYAGSRTKAAVGSRSVLAGTAAGWTPARRLATGPMPSAAAKAASCDTKRAWRRIAGWATAAPRRPLR